MPEPVDRFEVRRLMEEEGAQVAEVLPAAEYAWAHLAGAIHLPLKSWDPQVVASRLDADRPIVVYCNDFQ